MPDPLDPTDALFSAFTDSFVRYGSVFAASFGGHVLGTQSHASSGLFSALPSMGFAAVRDFIHVEGWSLILTWWRSLGVGLSIPLAWPFIGLLAWQVYRLRTDAELFQIIFWITVTQPPLSFIVTQQFSPLSGNALGLSVGVLVVSVIVTAGLLLWWRHTSETAPAPETESEPEL